MDCRDSVSSLKRILGEDLLSRKWRHGIKMWRSPAGRICRSCHQDMANSENEDDNVTCLAPLAEIDGVEYKRLNDHLGEKDGRCHDCNIKLGGIHHANCDVEICPVCDDQFIVCDCKDKGYMILEYTKQKGKTRKK